MVTIKTFIFQVDETTNQIVSPLANSMSSIAGPDSDGVKLSGLTLWVDIEVVDLLMSPGTDMKDFLSPAYISYLIEK
jgi:hypothetical protein